VSGVFERFFIGKTNRVWGDYQLSVARKPMLTVACEQLTTDN